MIFLEAACLLSHYTENVLVSSFKEYANSAVFCFDS